METPIAIGVAVIVAGVAAVTDLRSGTIPNWLTLPVLVASPLVYGVVSGPAPAIRSVGAALVCGLGPYLMFRLHSMGGGDVKLLAALGAVTGLDVRIGLQIQGLAFVVALVFTAGWLVSRGELVRRLSGVLASAVNGLLPGRRRIAVEPMPPRTVRMGVPILTATALQLVSTFAGPWPRS